MFGGAPVGPRYVFSFSNHAQMTQIQVLGGFLAQLSFIFFHLCSMFFLHFPSFVHRFPPYFQGSHAKLPGSPPSSLRGPQGGDQRGLPKLRGLYGRDLQDQTIMFICV